MIRPMSVSDAVGGDENCDGPIGPISAVEYGEPLFVSWYADEAVVTGGEDDLLWIHPLKKSGVQRRRSLEGHTCYVTGAVIAAEKDEATDFRRILSCGLDGRILLWLPNKAKVRTLLSPQTQLNLRFCLLFNASPRLQDRSTSHKTIPPPVSTLSLRMLTAISTSTADCSFPHLPLTSQISAPACQVIVNEEGESFYGLASRKNEIFTLSVDPGGKWSLNRYLISPDLWQN